MSIVDFLRQDKRRHFISITFSLWPLAVGLLPRISHWPSVSCSLRKAARQTAIDLQSDSEVALYHPRNDNWQEYFQWDGVRLVGLTAVGRATINALDMNRLLALAIREEEAALGRHPPPEKMT